MTEFVEFVEFCNKNAGFIMSVLTAIYVIATGLIAWLAHRSNALSAKGTAVAIKLELERSKPIIVVDFVPDIPFFRLRVRNTGQTTAYSIQFAISPEPKLSLGGKNAIPQEKCDRTIHFIHNGIASLAPGAELTSILGSLDRIEETHGVLSFAGTVRYADASRNPYDSPVDIDLRVYRDLLYSGRKGIDDVAKRLEDIHRELAHLATGFSKPHVFTQDIQDHRREQEEMITEVRRRAGEKQDGAEHPPANKLAPLAV